MDVSPHDYPQQVGFEGYMQQSNKGSCKKIGSMKFIPK